MKVTAKAGVKPRQPYVVRIAGNAVTGYREGVTLFSQGDSADSIFYLRDGLVKISVVSRHGKEAVIGIMRPGDFFGEGCLAGQPRRTSGARALAQCLAMQIEKLRFLDLLRDDPKFSQLFISHLLMRNNRVEKRLVDHFFNSSEQRLASILLELSKLSRENTGERVPIRVTQELLAEMIGTTRSRVSFFMNKFRRLGLIEYDGQGEFAIRRTLKSVLRS